MGRGLRKAPLDTLMFEQYTIQRLKELHQSLLCPSCQIPLQLLLQLLLKTLTRDGRHTADIEKGSTLPAITNTGRHFR